MALIATTGTWLLTALGAATVIFFKKPKDSILNIIMGFAAGVMIAASFWSLLQPAVERADQYLPVPAWLVATGGFLCGALFIWVSDKLIGLAQRKANTSDSLQPNERLRRVVMLILSITMHNIPEGLAVGVAFGALHQNANTPDAIMASVSIAVGIGLQNFPEGAAVALPLRREGYSRFKSFMLGQASGIVEPIAGVIGALLVVSMESILPFALAFAAGAMIIVAVHELIPECQADSRKTNAYHATMGIIIGFALMTLLDVMLS